MTGYERIKATIEHRKTDRIPIALAAPWTHTIERWHREGMPEDADANEFFGIDDVITNIGAFNCYMQKVFEYTVYEETEEYRYFLGGYGDKSKYWKQGEQPMNVLDYSIKTREDWDGCKWALDVSDERVNKNFFASAREARAKGHLIALSFIDHYWFSYNILGIENLCIQMATNADFVHDIYQTHTDFTFGMLEKVMKSGFDFDAVYVFSDMGYKAGPFFSPDYYERFLAPYYKRYKKFCTDNGMHFLIHTDGNMNKLLPNFIAGGFELINPVEARAGMDVRQLLPKYGKDITFFGNINADIVARGSDEEIEEEVRSKLEAAKKFGGAFILALDHSTPPTISIEKNRFLIECARKHACY